MQLSLLPSLSASRLHERGIRLKARPYVIQGQERPSDLPRLGESAATIEARVLAWFDGYAAPQTPSMCAEELGLKLTTVRPRICQLKAAGKLVHLRHVARRATEDGGSEGWYAVAKGAIDDRREAHD